MSKSKLTEKCDELRTYLTKYITETTFRLVSPERMAEKILKQTKGDLNIRFKVVRKENMKGGNWRLDLKLLIEIGENLDNVYLSYKKYTNNLRKGFSSVLDRARSFLFNWFVPLYSTFVVISYKNPPKC